MSERMTKAIRDYIARLSAAVQDYGATVTIGASGSRHLRLIVARPSGRSITIPMSRGGKAPKASTMKNSISRAVRFCRDGVDPTRRDS